MGMQGMQLTKGEGQAFRQADGLSIYLEGTVAQPTGHIILVKNADPNASNPFMRGHQYVTLQLASVKFDDYDMALAGVTQLQGSASLSAGDPQLVAFAFGLREGDELRAYWIRDGETTRKMREARSPGNETLRYPAYEGLHADTLTLTAHRGDKLIACIKVVKISDVESRMIRVSAPVDATAVS